MGEPAGRVDRQTSDAFVGREREMDEVRRSLEDALAGRGRLVLLAGEPGIGKTRLSQEIAAEAAERGFQVLWGRCHEDEGAPPYWPWVQILRANVRAGDTATLRAELGSGAGDVAQIVFEIGARFPGLATPVALSPAQARFRLFGSITTFLENIARRQPLVLVLDDLHWADTPSLLLLQFVAREIESARLLVVGTYRDVEVGSQHPLFQALGELVREPASRRLVMRGLGKADLARYIELTSGVTPSAAVVAEIGRETEGNPFFIGEIVRLLIAEGAVERLQTGAAPTIAVPQGVREVIGRRLDRLSAASQDVLRIAAVIGREFGLNILERTSELSRDRLLEVLEEAARTRLILEVPGALGHYRFSHALVRETLYDALPIPRRIRLHREVGEALERAHTPYIEAYLTELAHHFSQAAPGGDIDKAVTYARRAGDHATTQLAYEVARAHYEQALQALALRDAVDPVQHCDLLLALGEAHHGAGDIVQSRATHTHLKAARLARQAGDAGRLAYAAIRYSNLTSWFDLGRLDEEAAALLEEALRTLGPEDSVLRAKALAMLSRVLMQSWVPALAARAELLSAEALEVARRVGDPEAVAYALFSRWIALPEPDHLEERRAITTEWLRLVAEAGTTRSTTDPYTWGNFIDAYAFQVPDELESGDRGGAERSIEAYGRLADEIRVPWHAAVSLSFQALRAQMDGRFDEQERLAEQLRAMPREACGRQRVLMYEGHISMVRREQGRGSELEEGIRKGIARYPAELVRRVWLALMYADSRRQDDARQEFEMLAANAFTDLPHASLLCDAALLALVCTYLEDQARAGLLYELLLPYTERCVGWAGPTCLGSVAHYLGLLATTLERWEDAARHFEHALATNARMRLKPSLAHTRHEYARMLLARGDPGDRQKASELLGQALEVARALGMKLLLERAEELAHRCQVPAPSTEIGTTLTPDPRPLTLATFHCEGDTWTFTYGGVTGRVRDMKGLHYIAQLLRHPDREFHVLDLIQVSGIGDQVSADNQRPGTRNQRPGSDQGLPILDGPAKAAYRQRIDDLRAELEEAEQFHDAGRASRAREEIEALTEQLAAAVGLGGRDRAAASDAERARSAVTQNIKTALRKIHKCLPALADQLQRHIKTGTYCAYAPDPAHPIDWAL